LGANDLTGVVTSKELFAMLPLLNVKLVNPNYVAPSSSPNLGVLKTFQSGAQSISMDVAQASSPSDYTTKHNAILSAYGKYTRIFDFHIPPLSMNLSSSGQGSSGSSSGVLTGSYSGGEVSVGVYATASVAWGGASMTVEGAALVDGGEATYTIAGEYNYPSTDLFTPLSLTVNSPDITIGPVVFQLGISGTAWVTRSFNSSTGWIRIMTILTQGTDTKLTGRFREL